MRKIICINILAVISNLNFAIQSTQYMCYSIEQSSFLTFNSHLRNFCLNNHGIFEIRSACHWFQGDLQRPMLSDFEILAAIYKGIARILLLSLSTKCLKEAFSYNCNFSLSRFKRRSLNNCVLFDSLIYSLTFSVTARKLNMLPLNHFTFRGKFVIINFNQTSN